MNSFISGITAPQQVIWKKNNETHILKASLKPAEHLLPSSRTRPSYRHISSLWAFGTHKGPGKMWPWLELITFWRFTWKWNSCRLTPLCGFTTLNMTTSRVLTRTRMPHASLLSGALSVRSAKRIQHSVVSIISYCHDGVNSYIPIPSPGCIHRVQIPKGVETCSTSALPLREVSTSA